MTTENVVVELVTPASGKAAGYTAYSGLDMDRYLQVTTGAATVVVDGVTYTRTSPLRTRQSHGGQQQQLPLVADGQHSNPGPGSVPAQGDGGLPVYSQSGT